MIIQKTVRLIRGRYSCTIVRIVRKKMIWHSDLWNGRKKFADLKPVTRFLLWITKRIVETTNWCNYTLPAGKILRVFPRSRRWTNSIAKSFILIAVNNTNCEEIMTAMTISLSMRWLTTRKWTRRSRTEINVIFFCYRRDRGDFDVTLIRYGRDNRMKGD